MVGLDCHSCERGTQGGAPPPPDDLGLHMVEGDGDTGGLSLHHIHDVWLVQHSGGLLQGWAWEDESTGSMLGLTWDPQYPPLL